MSIDFEAVRLFREYDFDKDEDFQGGLNEILGSLEGGSTEEIDEIVGRAKVFYFSKKAGVSLSWDNIKHSTPIETVSPDEAQTLTFARLSELIQSGQTHLIPNNKEIPGGTNPEQPSESVVKEVPKKPWEK